MSLASAYAALARSNIHINHIEYSADGAPLALEVGFQLRFSPALTKIMHVVIPYEHPSLEENLEQVREEVKHIRQYAEVF